MNGTRTPHAAGRPRAGFSLIAVALALIVAAGGLLAIFGVFPISLRQSANSRGDMGEMTFASTVLETIAGNIRTIDRIAVWNDPEQFWDAAVGNTGLPTWGSRVSSTEMHQEYQKAKSGQETSPFSPATTFVAATWSAQTQPETEDAPDQENIWYFGEEEESTPSSSNTSKIAKPAQYLIRLAVVRRTARPKGGGAAAMQAAAIDDPTNPADVYLPNIYVVSVVSTGRGAPDVYIREPLYSQEFTFIHRP